MDQLACYMYVWLNGIHGCIGGWGGLTNGVYLFVGFILSLRGIARRFARRL